MQGNTTHINFQFWKEQLAHHPDKEFTSLIINGLSSGFKVGFNLDLPLKSTTGNLISTTDHQEVVSKYIQEELTLNHTGELGSMQIAHRFGTQISPIGVIPKKGRLVAWRLIMDLSSLEGYSVNDGIDKEDCSFHYVSVNMAATQIAKSGQGTLLAKMDIKQARKNILVAPQDRHLLGFQWQEKVYMEKVLPFGLCSSLLIFSATADALLWVMQQNGVSWAVHYVDNFLTIGKPGSDECQRSMVIMHDVCAKACLPLEPTKTQGPSEMLTFVGIELDSSRMEVRLPTDKLTSANELLNRWRGCKASRKYDLLSLIVILAHASKVVHTSRVFLRWLIKLSTTAKKPQHFIRLNAEAKSDIEWWY